jgi:hypothetical protein
MKHEVIQQAPAFHPVKVTITLETEQEAQIVAAVFNFAPLVDALDMLGIEISGVNEQFRSIGIPLGKTSDLADKFRSTDWFKDAVNSGS